MKKYIIKTQTRRMQADTIILVSIYLRIRDVFPNSLLLESSDYHGNENSYSFICLKPLAGFEINNGIAIEQYPDGTIQKTELKGKEAFNNRFRNFLQQFDQSQGGESAVVNGLFGYASYDAVRY